VIVGYNSSRFFSVNIHRLICQWYIEVYTDEEQVISQLLQYTVSVL